MGYTMIGLNHEAYVEEWYKRWCKGKAQNFVAVGKEPAPKVMKTFRTALMQGRVSHFALGEILQQIESESVRPFVKWADYSARLDRLNQLKRGLGFELN